MASKLVAPVVGISCEAVAKNGSFAAYELVCDHRYAEAVKDAGGHPVLLPIAQRKPQMRRYLDGIDGLVIVGGDDLDPRMYGERPLKSTHVIFPLRTEFERSLYAAGKRRSLPILGICHGMQLINVLEGGTLYQQIRARRNGPSVEHQGRRRPAHRIRLNPASRLAKVLGVRQIEAPGEHHQAVRDVAPGFIPAAVADDGIIEAIENPELPQILAVQWHPERQRSSATTKRLFKAFVRRCAAYRSTRAPR